MAKKEKILEELARFTEPVSPTQLAEKLGVPVNNFLNQLKRLVKKHFAATTKDGKYFITKKDSEPLMGPSSKLSKKCYVSIDVGKDIHIRINYSPDQPDKV